MSTPQYTLYIGSKNVSSWSLRGWLAMKKSGLPFEEKLIPLDQPSTPAEIAKISPSGWVPVLKHHKNNLTIHDSLAIAEYLNEIVPSAKLWPDDQKQRALARSICSEMHSGFTHLRQQLSMHCWDADKSKLSQANAACLNDIKRIVSIWQTCREQAKTSGDFLFGRFSIADVFYAPVVIRFKTYGVDLPPLARTYCETMWKLPEMQEWLAGAKKELS